MCAWPPARAVGAPSQDDPPAPPVAAAETRTVAQVVQVVTGILGYARWPTPPSPEPPLLCVTGSTPYAAALLAGGEAMSTVRARRVAPDDVLVQMCDALYVGDLPAPVSKRMLQNVTGRPVVTILEHDADCGGGMFCLNAQGAQVGFLINLDIIARSGVRIHPSVLQLARRRPQP
ncbi:hypothetical protein CEY04_17000 [Achromobacter sp. HZ28]|nr:hypothetical protein CEY04_17000 [Achromobacter sp. HZ28]OWT76683.1 hypothetical protein CEY05_12450 [Achromobacter sp. HZ34]